MSIEGATPAVVQARAVRTLWNRPQGYQVAQARESARSASAAAAAVREDAALRVASLFLDLERAVRQTEAVERQIDHLQKIEAAVRLRAEEGRDAPIEARRAALETARARLRLQQLASQRRAASMALAAALGLDPSGEIVPAREERAAPPLPLEEEACVAEALRDDPELRRLEAEVAARHLEARAWRAMRLPRVDLVAQYGLLAKFNNYEKFFNRFQRHNGQLGLDPDSAVHEQSGRSAPRRPRSRRAACARSSRTCAAALKAIRVQPGSACATPKPPASWPGWTSIWRASRSPACSPSLKRDAPRCDSSNRRGSRNRNAGFCTTAPCTSSSWPGWS